MSAHLMRRIHATDRRALELRWGPQLAERRVPSWLATLLTSSMGLYERRSRERRSGFDRRARVAPTHPLLPYTPQWPHN